MTNLSPDAKSTHEPLRFGDPIYKACSHCQQAIEIKPMLSGNALAGDLWSDGYMDAPQLPEQELLGKCGQCGEVVCLSELDSWPAGSELSADKDYAFQHLALSDYEQLLTHVEHISEEFHVYMRMRYWQLSNHQRRVSETAIPLSDAEISNLENLAGQLSTDDASRLLKAEVFRELGEFERAERVLSDPFQQSVSDVVLRLKTLVEEKNPALVKIYAQGI
jgi:hypothetical protein